MSKQILTNQISLFHEEYNKDKTNKIIENSITKNGLQNSCIVQKIIMENQPIFNLELPESKRYDQKGSYKCWIYAGLNVIKHNIAKNLNIDIMNFELSNNYIAFFDKLEKSNHIYETIIESQNIDFDYLNRENILTDCTAEGGYWQWFVSIVNKYGLVPLSIMPDCAESMISDELIRIFSEKVDKDIISLLNLKKTNASLEELEQEKQKFLQENYNLLSKMLGEPIFTFDYEYIDKTNHCIRLENLTPLQFKNQFLNFNLNDFISIGNVPMYNKQYNKVYSKKYVENIHSNSQVTFLNLPIEDLKILTINQLKDGIPVWFGAHIRKFRDRKSGILDTRLYNYRDTLNLKPLTKEEALNLHNITVHHAMTFCGVHLIDDTPIRWKVEDSYGDAEKVKGYFIMNDNFFDEFVFNVIIHKKYLSDEQIKLLQQKAIEFNTILNSLNTAFILLKITRIKHSSNF